MRISFHVHCLAKPHTRGFTLLEIVVALAVLALTLSVVHESLGWSVRRAASAQRSEMALFRAQSLLTQAQASPLLRVGPQSGLYSDGVKWRVDVERHPSDISDASPLAPVDVMVTVFWSEASQRNVQLKSIVVVGRSK